MTDFTEAAAEAWWKNDTGDQGHLERAQAFDRAESDLMYFRGYKKGQARDIIAEGVKAKAPPHAKTFGKATISHYLASYGLFMGSKFDPEDAELYGVIHRAYAASVGTQRIRDILDDMLLSREETIKSIQELKRPTKDAGEGDGGGTPKPAVTMDKALGWLDKIAEHGWTQDEKKQLFEAVMQTAVAVQPEGLTPPGTERFVAAKARRRTTGEVVWIIIDLEDTMAVASFGSSRDAAERETKNLNSGDSRKGHLVWDYAENYHVILDEDED